MCSLSPKFGIVGLLGSGGKTGLLMRRGAAAAAAPLNGGGGTGRAEAGFPLLHGGGKGRRRGQSGVPGGCGTAPLPSIGSRPEGRQPLRPPLFTKFMFKI